MEGSENKRLNIGPYKCAPMFVSYFIFAHTGAGVIRVLIECNIISTPEKKLGKKSAVQDCMF